MNRPYTESERDLIARLTEADATAAEIGQRIGRSANAISLYRSRYGVLVRFRPCIVCGRDQYAKRYCLKHYKKHRRIAA